MKKSIFSIVGIFALAAVANAQVIHDGFNYTSGTNNFNGLNGGSGFSGAWSDVATPDNLSITAGSITPGATMRSGYATSGNKVVSPNGLGTPTNTDFRGTRLMSAAINLDASSTTYFSFLALGDWTTVSDAPDIDVGFTGSASTLSANAVTIKKTYGGYTLRAAVNGTATGNSIANAFLDNSATFIVGKLVTSGSGNEKISFNSYATGSTVNGTETWNASVTDVDLGSLTGSLTHFVFDGTVRDSGMYYQFDEFRTGSSWDSVTAVPEPATWALLAGSLATLMVLRRSRNRA